MTPRRFRVRILVALLAVTAVAAAACSDDDDESTTTTAESTATTEDAAGVEGELSGLFGVDAGECTDDGTASGSYFRMVQPGGTLADGPFIDNSDSACADTTYTLLSPGTDGGLETGTTQPPPDPAFDDAGNGLADAIVEPAPFFAVAFAAATTDEGEAPAVTATDGTLSGSIETWSAYYGNEVFNQGAPKPDGELPGLTAEPTGTIDAETGAYVLEWSSQVVGGAFNDFTGVWHLEGTFSTD